MAGPPRPGPGRRRRARRAPPDRALPAAPAARAVRDAARGSGGALRALSGPSGGLTRPRCAIHVCHAPPRDGGRGHAGTRCGGGRRARPATRSPPCARADLDITDADAVRAAVQSARPDAVINCAAWTDVDGAEADEAAATAVNGAGAGHVAAAAAEAGALVVHVSTDYVFDGNGPRAVRGGRRRWSRARPTGAPSSPASSPSTRPAVAPRSSARRGCSDRTAATSSTPCAGSAPSATRSPWSNDQVGCPTYTGHLAPALVEVAERGLTGVAARRRRRPLLVARPGGRHVRRGRAASAASSRRRTAELGRPAPRPAFSALASTRGDAPVLPPWREGLRAHLARLEVTA